MRIRGQSKLNSHGDAILRMRREGKTIAAILLYLKENGVSAGQSTVSNWLETHPDELTPAGASKEPSVSKMPANISLGLLDGRTDPEQFSRLAGILRILWLPDRDWEEQHVARSVGPEGYGIPLNRDGEPDFMAFARQIGRKRVKTFGDMDFVLLALWTRKVRAACKNPVSDFAVARRRSKIVLDVARGIREEMFAAF